MSSMTGDAPGENDKDFKPTEPFLPSISNGFKLDSNFLTARDSRRFRLHRSNLPEAPLNETRADF